MGDFVQGVLSGVVASGVIAALAALVPVMKDRFLYSGVRVEGQWEVSETREGKVVRSGNLTLKQTGRVVTGTSTRTVTRSGAESQRTFNYKGTVSGHQMTLTFEDTNGVGFDTGSYVFTIQNDCKKMMGKTTFHGKPENKIVSEERILTKLA